jgi:flagellin-like hook-associated protein FlgL
MSLSNITLTAAVRQNLLSLQGTADLLATTQGRLATGKKVNSALDNPTNFFTAAGLDARASDISNLLDSIGNGVQVLQAANTGITSLSKLVDTAKSIANQVLQQPSGYSSKATYTGNAPTGAGPLAVAGTATDLTNNGTNSLEGQAIVFNTAAGATTITISKTAGAGKTNSITGLNTALAAAGIQLIASLNANGSLTFTSANDASSQTITNGAAYVAPAAGASTSVNINTSSGAAFTGGAIVAAVADPVSQATRASLVTQYNQIITQITTTAQDASFNGINLLNGDSLKLVFDETGKSTVTIAGVTFNPAGLGLASLTAGNDFIDNAATNNVLTALNTASITLRSQASAFGANLSIVQIRQDFNKNIINVLQTGSSALTLADTNEEAANSQALSTRQSIATSALSLANQSQQAVLQLLR